MNNERPVSVLRDIRTLFDTGAFGELSDGQLLRLLTARGDSAEPAFAALVRRHGAMVLGVCRAILRDRHDAEDAFQSTFLVLAMKAERLWVRDSLGPWLHAVARRVARCAASAATRRHAHERRAAAMVQHTPSHADRDELGGVLHEEVHRLPERFRVAVVLCDLEGLTQEQAAQHLGLPAGTVRSRLARARQRLRERLRRRGLDPAVAAAGRGLEATVSPSLVDLVVRTATKPRSVVVLAERVVHLMAMSKLRAVWAVALAVCVTVPGAAVLIKRAWGFQAPKPATTVTRQADRREPAGPSDPAPPAVSDARLEILAKLRDNMYGRYHGGEIGIEQYLQWQNRYTEAVLTRAKTDNDRIHMYERQLEGWKLLEARVKIQSEQGQATATDLLMVMYYRLELEEALASAKRRGDDNGKKGAVNADAGKSSTSDPPSK